MSARSPEGAGRHWAVAVVILTLAGAGIVLLSTAKYGAGLSPDSVSYFDVARSLVSGKGLVFHTGEPLVWWPPLYPMLLALIEFATHLAPATFVPFLSAVLFAVVIYLSARLLQSGPRQPVAYSLLGACAVLLSGPLSEVYAMAWSECLFIPLVLLYFTFAQRYWSRGGVLSLAVMTLSTALACLTRYIGVALVTAGVATIILASGVNLRTRFTRAFAFAALSLAPLGLWAVRNYRLTETFFGDRGPFRLMLVDNVIVCAKTMLSWYLFGLASTFVVLAWIAVLTITVLSSRTAIRRLTRSLKAIFIGQLPTVLFLVTYTIMLLMAAARDAVIDSRLLSTIYIPATLVVLKLIWDLFSQTQLPAIASVRKIPAVLLALWLCFPLTSVAWSTVSRFKDGAGGYSTKTWRESGTVAYARQMLSANDSVPVYSNGPDVLWALAGVNATMAPRKTARTLTNDLIGQWPPKDGILVWFKDVGRAYLFSLAEMEEIANTVEVARLSDGSIHRVSSRRTAVPDSGR